MERAYLEIEAIAPPIKVPQAAPNGAPRPKAAKAMVRAGSYLKVTPTIPNPAGEATARPRPQMARRIHNPVLFFMYQLVQHKAWPLLALMTAEMIEKMQKVDRPPRYNHLRPNRSASRPANKSPLAVSGSARNGCTVLDRRHHMTE